MNKLISPIRRKTYTEIIFFVRNQQIVFSESVLIIINISFFTNKRDIFKSQPLLSWINHLEKFNVFFSAPLDIDFLMLQYYKDYYLETLSTNEGPVVSYTDENSDNKKIKITKMDRTNDYQLIGFKNRISEAIQATLKDKSGPGDSFTEEEKELMIWYQYFFLGRGKPTTHMQFLLSIRDEELIESLPSVFEKIVKRAKELLGDIEYGEE